MKRNRKNTKRRGHAVVSPAAWLTGCSLVVILTPLTRGLVTLKQGYNCFKMRRKKKKIYMYIY